uniref:Jumonji domain containing 1C n=1 Tax=Molossus molossus TaxID=27622 RepID=A0A7J8DQ83_MOLMO|nr:jumonji domain containing 1C [Molossus molossus]
MAQQLTAYSEMDYNWILKIILPALGYINPRL